MAVTRYKKIKTSENYFLQDARQIPRTLVTSERVEQQVPWWEIERALRSPLSKRYYRLLLLNENETPKEDVTQWVTFNGSVKKVYNQGQTRTLDVTFNNPDRIWNPSAIKGKLWVNSKFKLEIGIELEGEIYYVDEGVYVCNNPTLDNSTAMKQVSVQLHDKFALLDGTINGTFDIDLQIPRNTPIEMAINMLLREPRDAFNNPFDGKPVIFPLRYKLEKTTYTIKKTAQNTIGDVLIDLANILSCDIFYNEVGNLVLREGNLDIDNLSKNVAWTYSGAKSNTSSQWPPFVRRSYKQGEKISNGDLAFTARRDLFALPENRHFWKADIPNRDSANPPQNGDRIFNLSANRSYEYWVTAYNTLFDVSPSERIGAFISTASNTPQFRNFSNVYVSSAFNLTLNQDNTYTTSTGLSGTYSFADNFRTILFDDSFFAITFNTDSFTFNGWTFTYEQATTYPPQVYIVQAGKYVASTHINDGWIEIGCSENFQSREWIQDEMRTEFVDLEFANVRTQSAWEKIYNRVVVTGANSGMGFLFRGIAENTNPRSVYNTKSLFGIKTLVINENMIRGTSLCRERARYELRKNMQRYITITFDSIYIPHIQPNDLVRFTHPDLDIFNELLLVQELTIPLAPTQPMSITLTNVSELPL